MQKSITEDDILKEKDGIRLAVIMFIIGYIGWYVCLFHIEVNKLPIFFQILFFVYLHMLPVSYMCLIGMLCTYNITLRRYLAESNDIGSKIKLVSAYLMQIGAYVAIAIALRYLRGGCEVVGETCVQMYDALWFLMISLEVIFFLLSILWKLQ